MKNNKLLTIVLLLVSGVTFGQCNQHVFTSVGATEWTDFSYQDCDGSPHNFGLPTGGYTIILCADIGTTFVESGDGGVFALLNEHPGYASCSSPAELCPSDLDGDGWVGSMDLLYLLSNYGESCD